MAQFILIAKRFISTDTGTAPNRGETGPISGMLPLVRVSGNDASVGTASFRTSSARPPASLKWEGHRTVPKKKDRSCHFDRQAQISTEK